MCGRYLSTSTPEHLAEHFAVEEVSVDEHRPRYNVAPSTDVYAIIERDQRRLGTLRWGFVPKWAKKLGGARQPINARLETISTSRMFAPSFRAKRCLLPADGFYEWQQRADRPKQPYHLAAPDGAPLAFAGIWTSWNDPEAGDAEPVFSAAIVTTSAKGEIRRIHERMPVILPSNLWSEWLTSSPGDAPHLLDTVTALGPPELIATPIRTLVNSVRNDGPELLAPADEAD